MRQNTLSRKEYIIDTIFWAGIVFIVYNHSLFKNLDDRTEAASILILTALVIVSVFINTVMTIRCRRNQHSVIATALIPYGIYSFMVYINYMPDLVRIVACVAIILGIMSFIVIVATNSGGRTQQIRIRNKARLTFLLVRLGTATASTILITGLLIWSLFMTGSSVNLNQQSVSAEKQTFSGNMDTLSLLVQEEWDKLSYEECKQVLEKVVQIEMGYLGIKGEIGIELTHLDDGVSGSYNDIKSTILISKDIMYSAKDTLSTCLHEIYHAYEHRLADIYEGLDDEDKNLYLFRQAEIPKYVKEFKEYQSARKSDEDYLTQYYRYYDQACEASARAFEKSRTEYYYAVIREYQEAVAEGRLSIQER